MQDGKSDMVQAASVSIHGPHGQYIENVHLEPFESEEQFWDVHYRGAYSRLLRKAEDFLKSTGASSDDTLVFIRRVVSPFDVASDSDIGAAQYRIRRFRIRNTVDVTAQSEGPNLFFLSLYAGCLRVCQ
jgi:hypothetical protein